MDRGLQGATAEETAGNKASGILVGIPAYNEEIAIGSVILAAREYCEDIVVVDDGSQDRTAEVARAAGATVIEHDSNRGKGGALKSIFEFASKENLEVLVVLDGDGQHLPADIPVVAEPVVNGSADITIGSRYLESTTEDETPVYRRFGQKVLDILTTGSTGVSVTDSQSGFRAFSRASIEELSIKTNGIGVESEMISSAAEANLDISEVPIEVRYDGIDGQTYNPLQHGLNVVVFLLQLVRDRHPLVFFGVPGLILTIFGAGLGIDGILVYQSTGNFYPAKVLVSGFTTIIGVLGVFCGLILNQISNMIGRIEDDTG